MRRGVACVAMVAVTSCSAPEATSANESETSGRMPDVVPRRCVAPAGLGAPASAVSVVELVNALPHPVTLPCFLESLDRPFETYASSSAAGAQPAVGDRSPRIFIRRDALMMTVVPEGIGRAKLEMSEAIGNRMAVKSELAFPVEEPLASGAPYEEVHAVNGTTCGVCHGAERLHASVQDVPTFASEVFQDDPIHAIPLAFVQQHARDCDAAAEPDRCAMLSAIYRHGPLTPWELPRDSKICREP